MAKNANLTIYQTRSDQAIGSNILYILLLQHRLKKLLCFQKMGEGGENNANVQSFDL